MKNVTGIGYWSQYSQANKEKEEAVKSDVREAMETAFALIGGVVCGFAMIVIAFTF